MADQKSHPFLFNNQVDNIEAETYGGIFEECTHLFGTDVKYVKRTLAFEEPIFGEFLAKAATEGVDMRLFVEQVEMFEGAGDMYSKFGLQLGDEMTVHGPKVTFSDAGVLPRPQDLILHVPSDKLFEITHVQDDKDGAAFYPLGNNFGYRITCKLYNHDYSETENVVNYPELQALDDMNLEDVTENTEPIRVEAVQHVDKTESDPIND